MEIKVVGPLPWQTNLETMHTWFIDHQRQIRLDSYFFLT